MILGNGPLSGGARQIFGDTPFVWLLYQSPLPDPIHDLAGLPDNSIVVLSTPSKIGTTSRLALKYPQFQWAYVPENVRERFPEDWKEQDRFVIGTTSPGAFCALAKFFAPTPCVWMSPESAEMVKHALNGFLALSIAYADEIRFIGEKYGANPNDVAFGIMSDTRIGMRAYLKPVGKASPHLIREVDNLLALGAGPIVKAART